MDVDFNAAGPATLQMTAPADGTIASPGYYMLFVIDADGVPSRAEWVQVS